MKQALSIAVLFNVILLTGVLVPVTLQANDGITRSHALSIYDQYKYSSGFTHFNYVNPDAPKGGILRKQPPAPLILSILLPPKVTGQQTATSFMIP